MHKLQLDIDYLINSVLIYNLPLRDRYYWFGLVNLYLGTQIYLGRSLVQSFDNQYENRPRNLIVLKGGSPLSGWPLHPCGSPYGVYPSGI